MAKFLISYCKSRKYVIFCHCRKIHVLGFRWKGRSKLNTLTKEKILKSERVKNPKVWVVRRQDERIFLRRLKAEMRKLGATEVDYALINRNMVRNALRNEREPRDVAWAIMQ